MAIISRHYQISTSRLQKTTAAAKDISNEEKEGLKELKTNLGAYESLPKGTTKTKLRNEILQNITRIAGDIRNFPETNKVLAEQGLSLHFFANYGQDRKIKIMYDFLSKVFPNTILDEVKVKAKANELNAQPSRTVKQAIKSQFCEKIFIHNDIENNNFEEDLQDLKDSSLKEKHIQMYQKLKKVETELSKLDVKLENIQSSTCEVSDITTSLNYDAPKLRKPTVALRSLQNSSNDEDKKFAEIAHGTLLEIKQEIAKLSNKNVSHNKYEEYKADSLSKNTEADEILRKWEKELASTDNSNDHFSSKF